MYMVECYAPAINGERARAAAERLAVTGAECRIDYLGALLMLEDEVVFHLFAASAPDVVREASLRAGIEFARVLEALPVGIELPEIR